jgi:hypothetical protein
MHKYPQFSNKRVIVLKNSFRIIIQMYATEKTEKNEENAPALLQGGGRKKGVKGIVIPYGKKH